MRDAGDFQHRGAGGWNGERYGWRNAPGQPFCRLTAPLHYLLPAAPAPLFTFTELLPQFFNRHHANLYPFFENGPNTLFKSKPAARTGD
jgi:hypothetical protein